MANQNNQWVQVYENTNLRLAATRVQNFVRMNPLDFLGSQICEDPSKFIDEVKKIFEVMNVTGMVGLSRHLTNSRM